MFNRKTGWGIACAALVATAACGNGGSAVETRDRAEAAEAAATPTAGSAAAAETPAA